MKEIKKNISYPEIFKSLINTEIFTKKINTNKLIISNIILLTLIYIITFIIHVAKSPFT